MKDNILYSAKKALLSNRHPHLVCLSNSKSSVQSLLSAISQTDTLSVQGNSFLLENGTKITVATVESPIPNSDFVLTHFSWASKTTPEQRKRVLLWEKKAKSLLNIFG